MSVEHVEVFVEEPSMEAFLRLVLPRMLGDTSFEVYTHQCKDELLMRLPERLRGYASWLPETWRIVVVVDRDDDCVALKCELERLALEAGLSTRSSPKQKGYSVVNRVAIEELEAWYFGDWDAVRAAYPRVKPTVPAQSKYRDPDGIAGGTWEAFEHVLKNAGYFKTGLRKIEAARAVGEHMVPSRNLSRSFQFLRTALSEMASANSGSS
ncbi:DUF4276 family protein [Cystobacter fuscus]|uniref:DUF4276 family protein n=1 Tax=Cystobacter fuscus TaxID=43 RepID=UPI000BB3275E|nr:DUF4276 family protein [Cystobacter fuscus]